MTNSVSNDLTLVLKQLRGLSPKEQIDTIVNNPDALALARSLPAEELLLTIKQVGINDSLELIELLSAEQVKVLFDLDVWTHDIIDNAALTEWIGALDAANKQTALEQMRDADIELLTLMLRNCAEIYDLLEYDDPNFDSDLILYTSDRHYLIAFKSDEAHEVQSRFLKSLLDDLMGRDFLFAIRLIESARWETDSLLHDDALRLRDGRLQDLGFLPIAERQSILTYVDVDKAKSGTFIPDVAGEKRTALKWNYNIPALASLPFLREALTGLSHDVLEKSWSYVVTAANRVHMAQSGKYSDADAVNESARYTLNHIEMAMSYLCEGNTSLAKQVFLSHSPQDLFKIGHSLVLRLQRDFNKLRQHPSFTLATSSLMRLDSPLLETMRGVLQPEPVFFAGLVDPKRVDYRSFENLRDIAQVSAAISEAAFRCALLGPKGLDFREVGNERTSSFGVLLATYFANLLVNGKPSFSPLSAGDFQTFFERLEQTDSGRRLSSRDKVMCVKLVEDAATALTGLVGMRSQEDAHKRAATYANIVFGLIETELGAIKDERPNPKFVTSVLVEHSS